MMAVRNVKKSLILTASLLSGLLLAGCGGDNTARDPNTKTLYVNFNEGATGWTPGFADYPAGEETFYELSSGLETLPSSLGNNRKGFKLSGNNHSDDLFMFAAKKFDGLEPNTRYDLRFKMTFGTNAQNNCAGIGGSPGNSVYIKIGATKNEPKAVNDGTGFLLLNWDKGNQAAGGSDAILAGDFANHVECGTSEMDTTYHPKTLITQKGDYSTITDENGSLWILMGTDSGYEGTTTIYLMALEVEAIKRL